MRVVLDPNVLISAAISRGTTYDLVTGWFEDPSFEVVACPMLIDELTAVLARQKFRQWIDAGEARTFIYRFGGTAVMVDDPETIPEVTGDPKDDYLVSLAITAEADGIVSGDADLRSLGGEPKVWTPRDFLDLLARQ